jgi:hypothetical protein
MEQPSSRSQYRSSVDARRAATELPEIETTGPRSGSSSKARERRRRRLHRQLSQRPHWTLYLGAALLAAGVLALVAAALLTR